MKTNRAPVVSFCFDDFPRSAAFQGADILAKYDVTGTFFVSLGHLGCDSPVGRIATEDDLRRVMHSGHEVGCHTYDHLDGWSTHPAAFMESIARNERAFERLCPSRRMTVFAYPITIPRPRTKKLVGRVFACCRGGGQSYNTTNLDLNLLKAYFLDHRNQNKTAEVESMIDESNAAGGWTIVSTHDVADDPSVYGCTRSMFEHVVRYAVESGAIVQPIEATCRALGFCSQSDLGS